MKDKARSPFAARLVALRNKAHLRQEDVAEKLQLSRTAYTRYENDSAKPEQNRLVTLAELFGVTVDYLLKDNEDAPALLADPACAVSVELTPREQEMLAVFRRLTPEQQDALLLTGQATIEETRTEK